MPLALRLLSLAAHELRTPAGIIGGCLRILRLTDDLERRERALAQAERSYERITELLAEMSDLWRLDAGEAVFNRHVVSVEAALVNAARASASRAPEGVALDVDAGSVAGLHVVTDPLRLERAFAACLLAVARRAAGSSGEVRARGIRSPAGTVRILIGSGRPEPELSFESGSAPLDEHESGLGLALPIARRVIEAEGGRIHALAASPTLALLVELPASSDTRVPVNRL